jgi:hypothetical protein
MSLTRASAAVIKTEEIVGTRNRIINGAMEISQRGTSFAGLTNNGSQYTADRWFWNESGTATAVQTVSQDSSAPTGFVNSLKVLTTTAQAPLDATNSYKLLQVIEGYNIADLNWGTANAQPITISFWVRSSLTGTFGGFLRNYDNNRYYVFSYTINSSDTWEQKSVTIAGDTSGTWLTNNLTGIAVTFSMGTGSSYLTAPGSWGSTRLEAPTGQVNVAGTLNATFYLTGVQVEVGSTATPFERRQFGTELALCQRYYFNINGGDSGGFTTIGIGGATSTTNSRNLVQHPVVMRAQPTVSSLGGGTFSIQAFDSTGSGSTIFSTSQPSRFTSYINFTTSGITAYRPTAAQLENTTSYTVGIQFSAELGV